LGFGPQPGALIRNQFANAVCLTLVEPVLRYWSSNTGEHFYTTNFNELGNGVGEWVSEGTHFHAYSRNESLLGILLHVPLYRYWSTQSGYHFYTTNPNEVAGLPEWQYEGIQCYVDSVQAQGDVKLLRYFNTNKGYHFYTTNPNEVAGLP